MSVINRSWSAGLYGRDRIWFSAKAAALARRMHSAASAYRRRASRTLDKAKSMGMRAVSARLGSAIRRSRRPRSSSESCIPQEPCQPGQRDGIGRIALDRPAEPGLGFVHVAQLFHEPAHADECVGEIRLQPERRLVPLPGLVVLALPLEQPAQVIVEQCAIGLDLDHLLVAFDGFGVPIKIGHGVGQVSPEGKGVGLELGRAAEPGQGFLMTAILPQSDADVGVGLSQVRVEPQRLDIARDRLV